MKKIQPLVIMVFAAVLFSVSCKKPRATPVITVTGSWRLVTYWDNRDETAKFSAYTSFDIHEGGHMQGVRGNLADDGVWTESNNHLTINFGTHPVLSTLNNNWLVETLTANSMKLKDDSPGRDKWILFAK